MQKEDSNKDKRLFRMNVRKLKIEDLFRIRRI